MLCALTLPVIQAQAKTYTLAAFGDSGEVSSLQARVIASAVKAGPYDALLLMGDNIYPRGEMEKLESVFNRPFAPLLKSKPQVWMVLGNHDIMIDNGVAQLKAFGLQRWSRETLGALELFRLDSNALGKEQMAWLEGALKSSKAKFKVLTMHHPVYSSGLHGNRSDLALKLEPLLKKYGVRVVMTGHDHNYERLEVGGVHYIVSGNSSSIRRVGRQAGTKSVARAGGFLKLTVSDKVLKVEQIDTSGATFDTLELK